MTPRITVIAPGPQTTVQDLGRPGYRSLGVPASGALDPVSLRLANRVLGNEAGAAALELRLAGPTLRIADAPTRVVLAGTAASLCIARSGGGVEDWAPWRAIDLDAGDEIRIGGLGDTATAYLAFAGGLDVPLVMNSRATCLSGGFGGHQGRAVESGDELAVAPSPPRRSRSLAAAPGTDRTLLRIVPGPQADWFPVEATTALLGEVFRVTADISRMGARLAGPELMTDRNSAFVSDGTVAGSVQVTGAGEAIVLLADCGTTGGYPKIATVVSADLPALGRALPGTEFRFAWIDVEGAEEAAASADAEFNARARWILPVVEPWPGR